MPDDATFDPTRRYRYSLVRDLRPGATDRKRVLWVMLNPSTADESEDDRTIMRIKDFSGRWGFNELEVVNLFALISTWPGALSNAADPIGPDNDQHVAAAVDRAGQIIVGWGAKPEALIGERVAWLRQMLAQRGRSALCLGRTQDGHPRHPARIASDTDLEEWRPP